MIYCPQSVVDRRRSIGLLFYLRQKRILDTSGDHQSFAGNMRTEKNYLISNSRFSDNSIHYHENRLFIRSSTIYFLYQSFWNKILVLFCRKKTCTTEKKKKQVQLRSQQM